MKAIRIALAATTALGATAAYATDIEVTHWWTSGGEAAAVGALAEVFEAQTGNTWVDGAIAGSGNTARPIMVSRITGGDPMGATQFNHGRQAEELVEAGLMRDLTDIAEAEGWRDFINPPSLLDSCTLDDRIYCAPVNIHSWQWLWLGTKAFTDAGVEVPANWDEFVAAGPALVEAGKVPLAMGKQGWQQHGAFFTFVATLVPSDVYMKVYGDKDADVVRSEAMMPVFKAIADARELSKNSTVQDWNQATNMLIAGEAGGQIMGDWAQGEFAVAGLTAGVEYDCLPGLGSKDVLSTGGDAFYFPEVYNDEIAEAQLELASVIVSPEGQLAFNLKKGSLPIRGDIDLTAANECMRKGLDTLENGEILLDVNQLIDSDTRTRLEDLMVEFFATPSMSAEDVQEEYALIIEDAD